MNRAIRLAGFLFLAVIIVLLLVVAFGATRANAADKYGPWGSTPFWTMWRDTGVTDPVTGATIYAPITSNVTMPSNLAGSAITPSVSASAAATSLILKASAGNYYDGYCQSSAAGKCILYNSATVPAAGALTPALVLECTPVAAGGVGGWTYGALPRRASTGIVMLYSTGADCNTYTVSNTAYIHGSVQ